MMVLVSYDVMTISEGGKKRLRHVAKECKNFGQRVQCSVFECNVDPAQWTVLRSKLIKIVDKEKDSLRFYFLGANWRRRIEHIGAKEIMDLEGPLVI
ncbi:MAG: CRISPR-associated endonuclease Cas2 [Deltaproteobacteria bacterium CG07_land_8_20_14_0_80_38_7]|nr:MAG: CRISPR-associated endonuclease Cas2 [Deltaproteobacteria bacterium CG07_land_8_20_14_0_80_38_7]